MGAPSLCLVLGLLAPAPQAAETVQPTLSPPTDDGGNGPQLRVPELSFAQTSTLRILGEGRFGTWSLIGSTIGASRGSQLCADAMGSRCPEMAVAQLGIAWRPFGSKVSLFSAVGAVSVAGLGLGMQAVGGLRIELPRWMGGWAPPTER